MDGNLEREIESLVAVEPSPEFLARLRARVADDTPRGSWAGWRLPVAAVGLAVAVGITVAMWPSNESVSPTNERGQSSMVERVLPQPRTVEPERVASAAVVEPPHTRRTGPAPSSTVAADRLVPVVNEEDAKGFDALLATLRDRRVRLVFDDDSPVSAPSISALAIPPITIEALPITSEGGLE